MGSLPLPIWVQSAPPGAKSMPEIIYVATTGDTGEILGAFISLALLWKSHEFSDHSWEVERYEHTADCSTAYYKGGTFCRVNIEIVTLHRAVTNLQE
jgi:hypothetical protein